MSSCQHAYEVGLFEGREEKSNYQKVREFHEAFGAAVDQPFDEDLAVLRQNLIDEEVAEVHDELITPFTRDKPIDKQKLAKELADLLYVTYGTAAAFGIPIDAVFSEVHRSNMSKLGADGKPIYRDDGKVLKGENYTPPDLSFIKTCCNTSGNC